MLKRKREWFFLTYFRRIIVFASFDVLDLIYWFDVDGYEEYSEDRRPSHFLAALNIINIFILIFFFFQI